MADQRYDAAFVVGAMIGGLIGGAYGLLNAPQAGAQTRRELAARWDGLAERLAGVPAALDGEVRHLAASATAAAAPLSERFGGNRPEATESVEVTGVAAVTVETEPVVTLPDPLEPDPIVPDEPALETAGAGRLDGEEPTVDSRAAELDVVIEGPRPAGEQR